MTRQETLKHFKTWCQNNIGNHCSDEDFQMANNIMALLEQQPKYNTDEWCHDCKEYDQEKHCCPRYNKVIRNTVEEIKQSKVGHWITTKDKCWWECSECGRVIYSQTDRLKLYRFCSRCGCRMVEPQAE